MAAGERVEVSGAVLRWAREQRGLALEIAAKRIGISEERLAAMEAGEARPTMAQLRSMGDKYKRPLIVLLLDEPPTTFTPLRDYRRLPNSRLGEFSPELRDEMKRASEEQEILADLRTQLGDEVTTPRLPRSQSPRELAQGIRGLLGVTMAEQRSWRTPDVAFNNWRARIEQLGILVLETSRVPMDEMRGFSMSERSPYIIVVNGGDAPRGKIFTMLHELAHLGVRRSGVCDLHVRSTGASDIEIFCNAVAGEALLPLEYLLTLPVVERHISGQPWTDIEMDAIVSVAGGASSEVVLRRLLNANRVSLEQYEAKRDELSAAYEEWRKNRSRRSQGGPPPYRVQLRDRGRPFVRSVFNAYSDGVVNLSELVDLVGVRTKHLGNLEREAFS